MAECGAFEGCSYKDLYSGITVLSPRIFAVPMNCKSALLLRGVLALTLAYSTVAMGQLQSTGAAWSQSAKPLEYAGGARKRVVSAPDNQTQAVIDGVTITVVRAGQSLRGTKNIGIAPRAELLWAPSSRALVISESDGGTVGTWTVQLLILDNANIDSRPIATNVIRSFTKQFRCHDPEVPNVGAIGWASDSRSVLLRGYRVSVPSGQILEEISQDRLRARWNAFFGERLTWLRARVN